MAAIDTIRAAHSARTAAPLTPSVLTKVISAVVGWNDARVTRHALSALSNRELEDIGLIRGDIDAVATRSTTR